MSQYKAIPQPQDIRSVSQNDILTNFQYLSTPLNPTAGVPNGILPVDHAATGDNVANPSDGFHKQSSYIATTTPASLTNAVNSQNSNGIAYANSAMVGGSTFTNDYYYFTGTGANQSNYPLNIIRSYGFFAVTPGPVLNVVNSFNINTNPVSTKYVSTGVYQITFNQPASGTNYGYLISLFDPTATIGTRSGYLVSQTATVITINFSKTLNGSTTLFDPTTFTVVILGV